MIKQFFNDGVIYGLGSFLTKGIAVILVPFYARVFTPSEYGILEILAVVTSFLNLTIALEVSQAVAIYFSESEDEDEKKEYASTALWFTIFSYLFFSGFSIFFASGFSEFLFESDSYKNILQVYLLSLTFQGVYLGAQNQLKWMLEPKKYILVSVTYALTTTIGALCLVLAFNMGLLGVVYAQLVAAIMGAALAIGYIGKYYQFSFNTLLLNRMLRFSLPLVPSSIAVFVLLYIDRIAIRSLVGLDALGVYGIGYRIGSAITLVLAGFMTAMTPLVYNKYKDEKTPGEIASIFRYFLALSLSCVLLLAIYARELVTILAAPAYHHAFSIVSILAVSIMFSQMYVFAPGLIINKRTKTIAVISIATAILNASLNYLLIPWLGILGAAIATLLAACTGFSINMILSQRLYFVSHDWSRLVIASLLVATVIAVFSNNLVTINWLYLAVFKIFFSIISLLSVGYILLGPNELSLIIKLLQRKPAVN